MLYCFLGAFQSLFFNQRNVSYNNWDQHHCSTETNERGLRFTMNANNAGDGKRERERGETERER